MPTSGRWVTDKPVDKCREKFVVSFLRSFDQDSKRAIRTQDSQQVVNRQHS